MDVSNIKRHFATEDGRFLPLVFAYGAYAYYFDADCIFDELSTVKTDFKGGDVEIGLEANNDLVAAIEEYGRERGDVWIDPDFRDSVANIVASL